MSDDIDKGDIDFSKLLGFEGVSDELSGGVDFKDPTVGAKIGAKIGNENDLPQFAPSTEKKSCGGMGKECCRTCPHKSFLP